MNNNVNITDYNVKDNFKFLVLNYNILNTVKEVEVYLVVT